MRHFPYSIHIILGLALIFFACIKLILVRILVVHAISLYDVIVVSVLLLFFFLIILIVLALLGLLAWQKYLVIIWRRRLGARHCSFLVPFDLQH